MYHPTDVHIGHRIRETRIAAGMTQTALADKLGITFQQVQKYETGANRISGSRLWEACQALGVDPNHFFKGLDEAASDSLPLNRGDLEGLRAFSAIPEGDVKRSLRRLMADFAAAVRPSAETKP